MEKNEELFEYENVNGVRLCLKVDSRKGLPKSKQFTVSYKTGENKSNWPKFWLFSAIIFNIVAMTCVRISVTALLVIFIVLSFLLFFWITHTVQSETLVVIPTVGIQSSIKYVCGREDNFVPWSSIDDVIINEVLKLNRVLYFLTVLVKINGAQSDEGLNVKLIPLFKYTKPRLVMLQRIYSEVQELLIESQLEPSMAAGGDTG